MHVYVISSGAYMERIWSEGKNFSAKAKFYLRYLYENI